MPEQVKTRTATQQPEKKIGPFAGGVSVAVWLNTIETADGSRRVRSVTISPRRFKDSKTGEWRSAGSYRLTDIQSLILGLEKAVEFMLSTRLPGDEPLDGEEVPLEPPADPQAGIPF
jgi:hypothetical protein